MRDEWFIRGEVPMTKSEVRAVSLSKLELYPGCVLWDVGAGTGSVSVEAALACPDIRILAFEYRTEAVELIRKNCQKAGTGAITVVKGKAPECFPAWEALKAPSAGAFSTSGKETEPTHAFIGGTAGGMEAILDGLWQRNPKIRIVMNVIALESMASVLGCLKKRGIEAEIVSVQIARAEKAGAYHLMKGQNPVYILSFGGE